MNKQSLKRLHYKKIFCILILITGILVTNMMTGSANAQTAPEISYPIAELGNCADKAACKAYCDKSEKVDACLSFAEKNNMMSGEEIKVAKNFKGTGMTGPGGCSGKDACSTYCSNSDHIDECVTFAEKNGMMSGDQLKEAKKVQSAIARGIKPPACGGKETCSAYCSSSEHMEECINFSIEAGIMDSQKAEESKKVLNAIKSGIKPPACNGKSECDAYCSSSEHVEECVNFGEAAGMISKEEADKIRNKGQQGGNGQGGPGDQQQGQGPDGQQGQNRQGPGDQGQGNGKQRPPQGQGKGQGGQGSQNNGGPGQGGQQQGQGSNGQQGQGGPESQQGPGGPGGQNQNQGGPENGGQPPTTN